MTTIMLLPTRFMPIWPVFCLPSRVGPFEARVVSAADRAKYGTWGAVINWPHVPVSAANLPDGRILTFASNQRTSFPRGPEFTYAAVYNPSTGQITEINHNAHDSVLRSPRHA